MKYLCLAYGDEGISAAMTPAELMEQGQQGQSGFGNLRPEGPVTLLASLSPTRSSTTLRPRNGKTVLYDGPYAESRGQVEGIFILEAEDLDEAIRTASRHPAARAGGTGGCAVEIRPIHFYATNDAARLRLP